MNKTMKDLVIIGAGGNGREIAWIAERINVIEKKWISIFFIDDEPSLLNISIDNHLVIGDVEKLINWKESIDVVCSIANPDLREIIISKVLVNSNISFPTLIDPSAILFKNDEIGEGSIIGMNSIITVNCKVGKFTLINNGCTIGHDFLSKDFVSIYPGVNIAGNVTLNSKVQVGTGAKIIQGLSICSKSYIGAGAVVIKNITDSGTYIGVPAIRINN